MSNPLQNLPPIYYLTLEGETGRQASIESSFQKYGITDFTRVYGYDGRKTDLKNTPRLVKGDYFDGMSSGDIAVSMGHIQMIWTWLQKDSKSDVALFMEDDINLDNCENWSFDWNDIMANLPKDWKAVQLAIIRSDEITEVRLRPRVTADWCVTAYILRREYAEWLVSKVHHYLDGWNKFFLKTPGDPRATPIVENLVYFPAEPHVYTFPIFTEKNTFGSTYFGGVNKVKPYNDASEKAVTAWWKKHGKSVSIDDLTCNPTRPPAIPMIGTAVVASTKWVKRLVESVDYPVNEFLIINNNGRGEIDAELDELARNHGNRNIDRVRVLHMPSNLGVPGSWNLMIKSYMKAPFWIIVNDDVAFCPGFLNEMHTEAMRDPTAGIIHGYEGDHGVGSWDLFLIRDWCVQEYGLFDENLYPAYNEDADYFLRILKKPVKRVMSLQHDYMHGEGTKRDYHTHGRQTSKSDSVLREKLEKVNLINIDYMTRKWGEGWRWCAPPNNHQELKYDLGFVRSKHLGF